MNVPDQSTPIVDSAAQGAAPRSSVAEASTADLAALLDNTTDYIWSVDTGCRLVYGNRVFLAEIECQSGHPLSRGDSVLDPALREPLRQQWRGYYARVLAGEPFRIELAVDDVSPSYVREYRFFPITDEAGAIVGASVRGRDVTEHQQTEEAMRRSEAMLNQAQAIGRIGSYVWDLRDDSLAWSCSMYELAGMDPDTFEGKLSEAITAHIHPADRASVVGQIEQMVAARQTYPMEFRLVRPDGKTIWLRSSARFDLDDEGQPIRAIGVHYDVTDEHRSHQLLSARLRLSSFATAHTLDELLQETIDEAEQLTDSTIGFFHFLDADQNKLTLQAWSTNTMRTMCTAGGKGQHYAVEEAGVWVDCVRRRQPILYNDYASLRNRRGLPEGHAAIVRLMTVPIVRSEQIVGVIGVGNKQFDYEIEELELFGRFADSVWDIVQVKRVEDALWDSRESYRVMVESSTDFIMRCDMEGRYLFGNAAALAMLDHAATSPIGKRSCELGFPAEFCTAWEASVRRVYEGKQPISFELELAIAGQLRTLDVRLSPEFSAAGMVNSVLGIARDISERKQAERELANREHQYRVLTETMKDVVWLLDVESGMFRYVSPSVYTLRGYTPAEIMAVPVDHATPPEVSESLRVLTSHRVADLHSGKVPAEHFYIDQVPQLRKSGSVVWTEVVSNYYTNPENGRLELRGVTRDITDRRQAEIALRQARDELEQRVEERTQALTRVNAELAAAMHVKDEFLSTMSHELRTPLNAILVMSQVLLEGVRGPLNERQMRAMQTITESGQHLLTMINDILDISTVQAGGLGLALSTVNVDDICTPLVAQLRAEAATRRQVIAYTCPAAILYVRADARRFDQIVRHLLENAMKFTPDGGQITLEVRPDAPRAVLSLTIEDNGIGIAKDVIERIFQPFTQADAALSRHYAGSGIGLTLVRRLVELHGGSIAVESPGVPGLGSRFTVLLPWSAPPIRCPAGATPGDLIHDTIVRVPARRNVVLVADDNPIAQQMLADALRKDGHEVVVACDGNEAVECARERNPDVILMDMQMPRFDGFAAIRRLRALPQFAATPIIALSGVVVPNDRKRCLDAGANDYLAKPVNAQRIVRIVAECLAQP